MSAFETRWMMLLTKGLLWPSPREGDPVVSPGAMVDQLVSSHLLHPLAERVFRKDKSAENPQGEPMTLYRHQVEAIEAAAATS